LRGRVPRELAQDAHDYPLDRLLAAASLVGAGRQHVPQLIRLLHEPEPGVRYWAAVGLTALDRDAAPAREALMSALSDTSAAVRIEAAGSLARLGRPNPALNVLTAELASPDLDIALHAARTIELMGATARPATAAMRAGRQRAEGEGDRRMFLRFATDGFLESLDALRVP